MEQKLKHTVIWLQGLFNRSGKKMRLGPTVSRCFEEQKACKTTVELTIANKLRFKHEKKYFKGVIAYFQTGGVPEIRFEMRRVH